MVNDMNKQRGFGLIEVLISMLVFAVGAVALVKLQGELIQGGSNANARSVALSIAQEKLDDLRAFQCVSPATTGACAANSALKPTYFDAIKNDAGGLIQATSAANPIKRGAAEYQLRWTVANAASEVTFNKATKQFQLGDNPRAVQVAVTVRWTDPDGSPQSVVLEDQINNTPPASVALSMENGNGQELGSIPLVDLCGDKCTGGQNLGNGNQQLAFDPSLLLSQNEQFVTTHFETITYAGDKSVSRREENLVINCECTQGGTDKGAEPARRALVFDVNGIPTGFGVQLGTTVTKRVGKRIATGQSGQQSPLCTDCCRDHHDHLDPTDIDNLNRVYDPWRPNTSGNDATFPSGKDSKGNPFYLDNSGGRDHSHFFPDKNGVLQPADKLGDTYLEACRMQRVNGAFQVMQDWNLSTIKVMPECFLEGGCPLLSGASGSLTLYQNYVEQYIKDYILALNPDKPAVFPTVATVFVGEPDVVKLDPVPPLANDMQMETRAVYIDFLTKKEIQALNGITNLGLVPFNDVRLTKLANWSSSSQSSVSVTSEPIKIDNNGNIIHSRGLVTPTSGQAIISANSERSNTGLTDTKVIDEHDGLFSTDSLTVIVNAVAPPPPSIFVTGAITSATNGVNPSDVQVTFNNSSCTQKAGNAFSFKCQFTSASGDVVVSGYVKSCTGKSCSITDRKVCFTNLANPPLTSVVVSNNGQTSETTTFSFAALAGTVTMDIVIRDATDTTAQAGFTCTP